LTNLGVAVGCRLGNALTKNEDESDATVSPWNRSSNWAALLLSIGAVASLLAGVLPDSMFRTATFPTAIALMGLGYSLWRGQAQGASMSVPNVRTSQLDPADV
jgi:hypothetical protein